MSAIASVVMYTLAMCGGPFENEPNTSVKRCIRVMQQKYVVKRVAR